MPNTKSQTELETELVSINIREPLLGERHTFRLPFVPAQYTLEEQLELMRVVIGIDYEDGFEDEEEQQISSLYRRVLNDNWLALKIGAIPFLGLLINDLYYFFKYPEYRYGNTLGNVFGGPLAQFDSLLTGNVKSYESMLLSHLGSDKVTDYVPYGAGVLAIVIAEAAICITQMCVRKKDSQLKPRLPLHYTSLSFAAYAYLRLVALIAKNNRGS